MGEHITVTVDAVVRPISVLDLPSTSASFVGQIIDTYDPLDPTIGWKHRWNGSEWKQLRDRSFLHIDAYGARGNDAAQGAANVAAFEAVYADCTAYGCTIQIGARSYYINDTLVIDKANGVEGITIRGENTGWGVTASRFLWAEDAVTAPMMWIYGSNNMVERLSFQTTGSGKCYSGIEVGGLTGAVTGITRNRFRDCQFSGAQSSGSTQKMRFGITIGGKYTHVSNLEDMKFEDCLFVGTDEAGVAIYGAQPYTTTFNRCAFGNYQMAGDTTWGSGIQINSSSASAFISECQFTRLTRGIWVPYALNITIYQPQSEACKRFYSTDPSGSEALAGEVTLIGGRLSASHTGASCEGPDQISAANESYIHYAFGGSFNIIGTEINYHIDAPNARLSFLYATAVGVVGSMIPTANAVEYLSGQPTPLIDRSMVYSHGNTSRNGAGALVSVPESRGMNATGEVTISDANTSATVTLAATERVATYVPTCNVVATTGTPAAGSKTVSISGRTTTQFVVNLDAAPGVGNSVTVGWSIR